MPDIPVPGAWGRPEWDGGRRPIPGDQEDAARRAEYWEWSEAAGDLPEGGAEMVSYAPGNCHWAKLENAVQADYEARHMRHSIGYNWDHYTAMGQILSLRSQNMIPWVTILVAENRVVHARRAANAPLGLHDLRALRALARAKGWTVAAPATL